jgi:hypothetical protein
MSEPVDPEIDALIAALFGAFDNQDGRKPAVAALRDLFLPDGRVTRVSPDGALSWDIEAFIAPRAAMLTDGRLTEFHEWETSGDTWTQGAIAVRRSHYRKQGVMEGEAYAGEGHKVISLCLLDGRWRIASVLWEDL